MNPYVSIDIETTGLDPETCQVLSIGAVIDDWKSPIKELPTFHCYINHGTFTGEPFALSMHSKIFRAIAEDIDDPCIRYPDAITDEFDQWLYCNRIYTDKKRIVVAGKNFGVFDYQFLKRLPNWKSHIHMKHRFIDPGNLYFDPIIDDEPPNTETCMARAGILDKVTHTALEDALMVVRLIRFWGGRLTPNQNPIKSQKSEEEF